MTNVSVRLDSYKHYPGNLVTGQAVCYFRSPKDFRKIRIRLTCNEHTSWMESENYYDSADKRNKTRTIHCSGDRSVLVLDDVVQGRGTLPRGEHIFPIKFRLPGNIPSTYSCQYGDIKYTVKLTIDREFKFDLEDEKEFTVFSPIKLQDMNSEMLRSEELSDDKQICCWCCAGGNIEMQVTLERKAFVIGHPGKIKVYILNMSNASVDDLVVKMKQKFTYRTTSPEKYKHDSELVASANRSGVGAHGDNTYNIELEIPPCTVAPNFVRCELFRCEYDLEIEAVVSGCHTNLEIKTDAGLGHFPLPGEEYRQQINSQQEGIEGNQDNGWVTDSEEVIIGGLPLQKQMPIPPVGMPMPMPSPGYGFNPCPYPVNPSTSPSAPSVDAPSAPSKLDVMNDNNTGSGRTSDCQAPPPTYEEAAASLNSPKQ